MYVDHKISTKAWASSLLTSLINLPLTSKEHKMIDDLLDLLYSQNASRYITIIRTVLTVHSAQQNGHKRPDIPVENDVNIETTPLPVREEVVESSLFSDLSSVPDESSISDSTNPEILIREILLHSRADDLQECLNLEINEHINPNNEMPSSTKTNGRELQANPSNIEDPICCNNIVESKNTKVISKPVVKPLPQILALSIPPRKKRITSWRNNNKKGTKSKKRKSSSESDDGQQFEPEIILDKKVINNVIL